MVLGLEPNTVRGEEQTMQGLEPVTIQGDLRTNNTRIRTSYGEGGGVFLETKHNQGGVSERTLQGLEPITVYTHEL